MHFLTICSVSLPTNVYISFCYLHSRGYPGFFGWCSFHCMLYTVWGRILLINAKHLQMIRILNIFSSSNLKYCTLTIKMRVCCRICSMRIPLYTASLMMVLYRPKQVGQASQMTNDYYWFSIYWVKYYILSLLYEMWVNLNQRNDTFIHLRHHVLPKDKFSLYLTCSCHIIITVIIIIIIMS